MSEAARGFASWLDNRGVNNLASWACLLDGGTGRHTRETLKAGSPVALQPSSAPEPSCSAKPDGRVSGTGYEGWGSLNMPPSGWTCLTFIPSSGAASARDSVG